MPQPPNLQKMLAEAQAMLAQQQEAQEKLKEQKVDASAGGGMVKVAMTGDMRAREPRRSTPTRSTPRTSRCCRTWSSPRSTRRCAWPRSSSRASSAAPRQGGFDPMSALESLGLGGMGGLGGGGGGGAPGRPAPGRRRTAPRAAPEAK